MLGLANTISSSSTPESKYSLSLDGTDDFIDCGLIDFDTDNFSVSCWVKTSNWDNYECIWSNRNSAGTEIGFQLRTNGTANELTLFFDYGGSTIESTVDNVPADTWFHIVCTVNRSGNQVVYLNNDAEVTTTDISAQSGVSATNALNFFIGKNETNKYHQGKITDVAVWNTALDANNVAAIYNSGRPTNLNINSGNYIKAASLQAYYRMGNGTFDDKANGVIHDQNTSNRIYNGDFEVTSGAEVSGSDILDWVEGADPDEWVISGGAASIDGEQSGAVSLWQNVYTLNKTYKTKLDVVRTAGTLTVKTGTLGNSLTITSSGTYEFSGVADNNIKIDIIADAAFTGSVDNIDVREVGGGHGFGAELVTNGTFTGITQSESTTGSEWTTGVGWTISGDIARSDGTQTDVSHLKQLGIVPINKCYEVVFDIVVEAGSMVVAVGGSNAQPTITSTNTYTYYTRATGGDSHFYFSAAANFVGSIDNVTVKELNGNPGLTSGDIPFTSDVP
jgi:hypothetical protein